jgi:hypothetical protein
MSPRGRSPINATSAGQVSPAAHTRRTGHRALCTVVALLPDAAAPGAQAVVVVALAVMLLS